MFLSGILGSSSAGSRNGTSSSSRSRSSPVQSSDATNTAGSPSPPRTPQPSIPPEYIADESQLQAGPPIPEDVIDLNRSLEVLAAVFPDVQIEVFREMLASFSEESRLAVVADAMLKSPSSWVKGRKRASGTGCPDGKDADDKSEGQGQKKKTMTRRTCDSSSSSSLVPRVEAFKTEAYRDAVRALALSEFKGLSRSSISAVLSESNFSYLDARPTLVNLSSKSWKFTLSTLIFRRKPVTSGEAENHPLVVWKSSGQGSIIPTIKSTGNAELDRELFEELVLPLQRQEAERKELGDRAFAMTIHTEEAEAADATYECACCYTDATFEEFTTCNVDGHMICFRCVQHSITEAVFGQAWQRSINKDTGTLKCPAVSNTECEGCISSEHIHRAMREEKGGAEILHRLDQRLAEHGLLSSDLTLVRCPFCSYAEVDDLYVPSEEEGIRLHWANIRGLALMVVGLCLTPAILLFLTANSACLLLLSLNGTFRYWVSSHLRAATTRFRRRRIGLKFTCKNLPECGRSSCLSCSKAWHDIHICHESSLVALRTQVEQAMSMAIKRVCPRCSTSFVKTDGCNKLTCPCGYKMCYVCRRDIGAPNEGYQHFCQHFRPEGDGRACGECNKCNLWESENTEMILRAAKDDAERKWMESERRELNGAEKAFLETGVGNGTSSSSSNGGSGGGGGGATAARRPSPARRPFGLKIASVADICDIVLEFVYA